MSGKERVRGEILERAEEFAGIPNAPFFYRAPVRHVVSKLEREGFTIVESSESLNRGERNPEKLLAHDDYALYARIRRGDPKGRLMITTHLDHPFVVLDAKGGGIPLGTIDIDKMAKTIESEGLQVRIYSRLGEHVDEDVITGVNQTRGRRTVVTEKVHKSGPNLQAIWAIKQFEEDGGLIKMLNSDNMVNTAIIMQLIAEIGRSNIKEVDVEFVFSYLEEIKQISATGISLRGRTPFGKINDKSLVVVLESASVETPEGFDDFLGDNGMQRANYDDGVILRINDLGVIYGQRINGKNLAESTLIQSALKVGVSFQRTLLNGTCDATSYTLFTNTPNIAGITIPTRNRHNCTDDGRVAPEIVRMRDVMATRDVLMEMIRSVGNSGGCDHKLACCEKLKSYPKAPKDADLRNLAADRIATLRASLPRLSRAKFYPEGVADEIDFALGRVLGRLSRELGRVRSAV